jgi:tetratricopeptide (TPR) repeat protein
MRVRAVVGLVAAVVGSPAAIGQAVAPQPDRPPVEPTIQVIRDWTYYNRIGSTALDRGQLERAAQAYRLAVQTMKPYEKTDAALLARSYAGYARVLHAQHRDDDAEPLARWAMAVRDREPATSNATRCEDLALVAAIVRARRRPAEAEPLLAKLLALQESTLGTGHSDLIATVEALADAADTQGKAADAERFYRRSLSLRETSAASAAKEADRLEQTAETLRALSRTESAPKATQSVLNRMQEADRLETRARTIRESSPESPSAAATTERFAALLRRSGRFDEADDLDARARALRDAAETREARARKAKE